MTLLAQWFPWAFPKSDASKTIGTVGRGGRLIVDLSTIAQRDAGTGIQRVVRALWQLLETTPLEGYRVVPVAATVKRGYCVAPFDGSQIGVPAPDAALVEIGAGDIFLGLDLAAHRLWRHRRQLARWRRRGARIAIVVYDLLPLIEPDWFPPSTVRNFKKWIRVLVKDSDVALCISGQVADDLRALPPAGMRAGRGTPEIALLPLSGDIRGSRPSLGIDEAGRKVMMRMEQRQTLLMVGTVEPRKAHAVLLDAFDHLLDTMGEGAPDLVMVGRPGWRTDALQGRMLAHAEQGRRFHWLADASDELLSALYERAALVVVPSHGEGFGLPVVEALDHGRKVLARDLPVFREVAREGLFYFPSDAPEPLANAIRGALAKPVVDVGGQKAGWEESLSALLQAIAVERAALSRANADI